MNKFFKLPLYLVMTAMMGTAMISCSDNNSGNNNSNGLSDEEQTLKEVIIPYVDNTIIATYKAMADEAILMSDACTKAKETYLNGDKKKATEYVDEACEHWTESRKAWELSEAFLFGAAGDYNIDPHIDSWPLDQVALDNLLNNQKMMDAIGTGDFDYITSNLGYGLLGYHALEYILFQLTDDSHREPRNFEKTYSYSGQVVNITNNHMIYMAGVAQDLRNQCIRLEASWAGIGNVTTQKQEILADTEQEPTFDYGTSMKTAGQGGSKYTSYTVAAQELIQGCIDIVDEVCTQKIGRPNSGQTADDKNYIESPYALNSVVDFTDNIKSVKNAYEGIGYDGKNNSTSVSAYIATVDPTTDTEVKTLIDESITKIQAIPEPFAKNATGAQANAAIESLTKLSAALNKANKALLK